ncbi:MAG: DNA alkylation repair protein [Saprospiraceae bacterium]
MTLGPDFLLRDVFSPQAVQHLAQAIKHNYPEFAEAAFVQTICSQLPDSQFGERSRLITNALHEYLPKDFPTAVNILLASLMPEINGQAGETEWERFIVMPQCDFVSRYGKAHYELSMQALYEMTKRFTAEGDLRTFVELEPEKSLEILHRWAEDPNVHVRRLVSEGTRPRLPLGRRLKLFIENPQPLLTLLEKLKNDPELYVRRSVANNLNDIAKDNPDVVVETLERWQTENTPEMNWLIRHATRTLIKQGHPGALQLLGSSPEALVEIMSFSLAQTAIHLGDSMEFSLALQSTGEAPQQLIIDYAVYFMKKNGTHAPKVFKWTKRTLQPGETVFLSRRQHFRPISTRQYYSGEHLIAIQINGKTFIQKSFQLQVDE